MKLKPLAALAAIAVAAPASAITVLEGSVDAVGSHQFVTQDGYVFAGKGLYNVTATFSGAVTDISLYQEFYRISYSGQQPFEDNAYFHDGTAGPLTSFSFTKSFRPTSYIDILNGSLVFQFSSRGPVDFKLTSGFYGGAIPEPATWAMMIAGFGLVGCTMRLSAKQKSMKVSI